MLRASDVTIAAGNTTLVRRASVAIGPGEFVALLGANGAGKSTLLKALAGDVVPVTGEISMNGRPMRRWSLRERAGMRAVMPQHTPPALGFTALEIVLMGRYPHSSAALQSRDLDIARSALEQLDVAHLAERVAGMLSGGELARVHLARALAQLARESDDGPRYLLLDEPTASLDPAHRHLAMSTAQTLTRARSVGVLAVLHDLNLAAQYADRIVLLRRGEVVASGAPDDVLTHGPLTACFDVEVSIVRHPRSGRRVVLVG